MRRMIADLAGGFGPEALVVAAVVALLIGRHVRTERGSAAKYAGTSDTVSGHAAVLEVCLELRTWECFGCRPHARALLRDLEGAQPGVDSPDAEWNPPAPGRRHSVAERARVSAELCR